jgi:hypothetical protein
MAFESHKLLRANPDMAVPQLKSLKTLTHLNKELARTQLAQKPES